MSTHLEEYLDYYQTLNAPKYAVLVTGEWGTGKTYQVKKCIPEDDRYYVSLFGVQTVEQLHAEVFAVASPTLAKVKKTIEKAADMSKDVGGLSALAGLAPSLLNAILKTDMKPNRTLIFDDLERSDLALKDVLGAINTYVEQQGFRVIVIAHDDKMTEEFLGMKEKTFGQTIRVQPQIPEAMDSFVKDIEKSKDKQFLITHRDAILEVFKASEERSLRVLRHVVEDIQRLTNCLADTHLENGDAMHALVQLFTAFDIETRGGNIGEADLQNRFNASIEFAVMAQLDSESPPAKPPLTKVNEKYITIDLTSNLLSKEALHSMFFEGRYPKDEIRRSLDESSYFIEPSEAAPWKIVSSFDSLDDADVEVGRIRMEKQFSDRRVTNSGEMLHIFALKMMMAKNGIYDEKIEDVAASCKTYIDDLLANGKLPPRKTDWTWFDEFADHHEGQGYWVSEKIAPYFSQLKDYLIKAREKALENQFPQILDEFLNMIATDAKQFFEAVSPTNNDENPYYLIPILHHLSAEKFVETWMASPRKNWRYIQYSLDNRYSNGKISSDLSAEKEWAIEVHNLLEQFADEAEDFSALRIRRVIPKELKVLVAEGE